LPPPPFDGFTPKGAFFAFFAATAALRSIFRVTSTVFPRFHPEGRDIRVSRWISLPYGSPRCLDRVSAVSLPEGRRCPCSEPSSAPFLRYLRVALFPFPGKNPEGRVCRESTVVFIRLACELSALPRPSFGGFSPRREAELGRIRIRLPNPGRPFCVAPSAFPLQDPEGRKNRGFRSTPRVRAFDNPALPRSRFRDRTPRGAVFDLNAQTRRYHLTKSPRFPVDVSIDRPEGVVFVAVLESTGIGSIRCPGLP
jgi:hypothetical protein